MRLTLPVMGAYADTAPYDCEKSRRILEQGCAAIAKVGFKDQKGVIQIEIANALWALARGVGRVTIARCWRSMRKQWPSVRRHKAGTSRGTTATRRCFSPSMSLVDGGPERDALSTRL